MSQEFEIVPLETSEKIRLTNQPFLMLRTGGASYLNKKAGALLELKHEDAIRFYQSSKNPQEWYVGPDEVNGAILRKDGNLLKFSHAEAIRRIFASYDLDCKKAFVRLSQKIDHITTSLGERPVLFLIPKPFNVE